MGRNGFLWSSQVKLHVLGACGALFPVPASLARGCRSWRESHTDPSKSHNCPSTRYRTDARLVMRLLGPVMRCQSSCQSYGTLWHGPCHSLDMLPKCIQALYMAIGTHCGPWPEPAELRIARTRSCHSVPELMPERTRACQNSMHLKQSFLQ